MALELVRDEDDPPRWFAGASVGRRSGRIKAALIECQGDGWRMHVVGSTAVTAPAASETEAIPERIARELAQLAERTGVRLADVEALGLHDADLERAPLAAAALAEWTGVTTVGQFAMRDRACGGRGHPLSPIPDWFLFRSARERRLLLHVGAVLRVLVLEPEETPHRLLCFDAAPCCAFLDALANRLSLGRLAFDPNGQLAVQGKASPKLTANWSAHPFFLRPAPRSIAPEDFDADFHERSIALARDLRLSAGDLLCSANHLVVQQLTAALRRLGLDSTAFERVIVTGGGVNNGLLWKLLQDAFAPLPLERSDAFRAPTETLRPMHAALLAYCVSENLPGNVPLFTGSAAARLLGAVTPGSDAHWRQWIVRLADRFDELEEERRAAYYRRAA
jgi:anhydro-N-acetylmuramic acid kinase